MERPGLALFATLIMTSFAWGQTDGTNVKLPKFPTIIRPDVQAELKLTDDQYARVKEKLDGLVKEFPNGTKGIMVSGDVNLDAIEAEIDSILNEKQRKRFKEVWLQVAGVSALLSKDVADEVGLKVQQRNTIQELHTEQMDKMHDQLQFDGEQPPKESLDKIDQLRKDFHAKVEKLLTKEQTEKWKAMQGAKFVMKEVKNTAKPK